VSCGGEKRGTKEKNLRERRRNERSREGTICSNVSVYFLRQVRSATAKIGSIFLFSQSAVVAGDWFKINVVIGLRQNQIIGLSLMILRDLRGCTFSSLGGLFPP